MFRFPYIKILFLLLALPFVCSSQPSGVKITKQKYDSEKTRILFIVDCSYSMNERWQSNTKIKIAQSLISNIVDTLALYSDVETALRVFGNEKNYSDGNCDDTQLLTPFYRLNADNMKAKLKTLIPKGTSAVAKSLQKAADDFPSDKNCRNIVIMIVDNIDKCDGDVSAVSQMMQKQGKYIRPFIIGTSRGMKNIYENCGNYYEVKGEVEFSKVLNNTIKQALHGTTLQVNLLDVNMEATETNVPITFYDSESHNLRYSFIHSFSANGTSDTVSVDPLVKY
ncbi:MAG: VWA domain-containing protein, partial [Bacteroidales bacterium]|nr:VWA domain-containing protein [Bacteroidales bacterium]